MRGKSWRGENFFCTGFWGEGVAFFLRKDFEPREHLRHFKRDKIIMHADRYSWFAAAAADQAVKQSGLEVPFVDPYRAACIIGSGAGGLVTYEKAYRGSLVECAATLFDR